MRQPLFNHWFILVKEYVIAEFDQDRIYLVVCLLADVLYQLQFNVINGHQLGFTFRRRTDESKIQLPLVRLFERFFVNF